MRPVTRPPRSADRRAPRERGFVLAAVLVLLMSLTLIVTTQVRRANSSQTITANSSEYVLAEAAAQSVLRYCEASVMQSIGQPESVRVTTPGVRGVDTAAWRTAAKWAASAVDFGASGVAFPGVQAYQCLFEDATADLVPSMLANDINRESVTPNPVCEVQPGVNPRLCKYRVTARVVLDRGRQLHLQSEIRFAI